jgi:hypothetical protein
MMGLPEAPRKTFPKQANVNSLYFEQSHLRQPENRESGSGELTYGRNCLSMELDGEM